MLALINREKFVPYRNSMLTHMLAPGMKKGCRVAIVVTVSPDDADAPETAVALGFGTRARQAKLGPAAAASGHAKGARAAEGFKQRSRSAPSMEGRVRELEAKEAEAIRRAEAAETSAEQNLYAR